MLGKMQSEAARRASEPSGQGRRRTVARDNTVKLGEHTLQLLPGSDRYSYARARVELQERLDGSLVVDDIVQAFVLRMVMLYQGMVIATTDAPPHPAGDPAG